jgi:hypothetical protein
MTLRTLQCEVFWPFNSSSDFSGVLEDSKFPLLGVWASPSHLAQSGVATVVSRLEAPLDFLDLKTRTVVSAIKLNREESLMAL